jgi:exopolysaccharide production protein ExoQ
VTTASRNITSFESSPRLTATAWCVGALLAVALIGMLHDRGYANASGMESTEAGRDLETSVKESGLGGAASARFVGLACLLVAGALCIATLPAAPRLRWNSLTWLILLGLTWTGASCTWSDHPGTTVREFSRLLMYVGIAAALASRFDLRSICCIFCIMLSGSVLAAVGYEVVSGGFRPWQADYRLTGTLHSNALAIQAGVVAIIALAFGLRGREHKMFWYALVAAAVAVIVLTKTRTAMATVGIAFVVIHFLGRPVRESALYVCAAASLAALAAFSISVLNLPLERHLANVITLGRSDGSNDDHTLTGRVPLWQFIWEETADVRLQGVGYGAFWLRERTEEANDALQWYPRQSHNAYIDIMSGIGFVGLAIALTVGVVSLVRAMAMLNVPSGPEVYALIALLCVAFINGISETAFVTPRDVGLVMATLISSLVIQPACQSAGGSVATARSSRLRQLRPARDAAANGGSHHWPN